MVDESWDPVDDVAGERDRPSGQWDWHGRASWGHRAVAAFPAVAVAAAAAIVVSATVGALVPAAAPAAVTGTGGATLTSTLPVSPTAASPDAPGHPADYRDVTFTRPSGPARPIEGSTSLTLPPYLGWIQNGSASPTNGTATASGGLLHVGVRQATPSYRGWFLTTTGTVPDSCAFQFSAGSPPDVPASAAGAVGELVMAVQTGTTVRTGDINYVVVAELVHADGHRTLQVGYATGYVRHAVDHVLKQVPWAPGPLQVAVETDGDARLEVWVNGALFLSATGLSMGITPPFQPYLEVQAVRTPYSVAFSGYSSVCGDDIAVSGLPSGAIVRLGGRAAVARSGVAVLTADRSSPPVTGALTVTEPGRPAVRFSPHTYWPGDRFRYAP